MSSCGAGTVDAGCGEVLTASLLVAKAEEEAPVLMSWKPLRGQRLVKEAWSVSASVMMPAGAEARSILGLAFPMILTGLLLYLRSMISMLFLGRLGGLALAGGSLAMGFANITGYSVLSGLAMGMEPICGQALGAGQLELLGATTQRAVVMLLAAAAPIAALWAHMRPLLVVCGQDAGIAAAAETYILASLPDLLLQAFLHPVRIYLRAQSINLPLTLCAALAIALHLPINYLLVVVLGLGVRGVALASVLANLNLLLLLLAYILCTGVHRRTKALSLSASSGCLMKEEGWVSLLRLAVPSCVSVCLEWWWYELMVLLCGLLADPQATVASMGILIQTTSLIYIFPSSLGLAVSTRVSNELGANRADRAAGAATAGLALGFAFGAAACAFAWLVRGAWAAMFTADPAIVALTASVLPILGACELGNCPQTTGCGVLRGSARPNHAAAINLRSFYLVGTPVALLLAFWCRYDFRGLWLGLLAAQATCVVRMMLAIATTDWQAEANRAQQLAGLPFPTAAAAAGRGDHDHESTMTTIDVVIEQPPKDHC